MNAHDYLMARSPLLVQLQGRNPGELRDSLRGKSSGERVMISAAIALHPDAYDFRDDPHVQFHLRDMSRLDFVNTQTLLEALAIAAGHPEMELWS